MWEHLRSSCRRIARATPSMTLCPWLNLLPRDLVLFLPGMLISIMNFVAKRRLRVNDISEGRIIPFPSASHLVIGHRNWMLIECQQDELVAKIRVEHHLGKKQVRLRCFCSSFLFLSDFFFAAYQSERILQFDSLAVSCSRPLASSAFSFMEQLSFLLLVIIRTVFLFFTALHIDCDGAEWSEKGQP